MWSTANRIGSEEREGIKEGMLAWTMVLRTHDDGVGGAEEFLWRNYRWRAGGEVQKESEVQTRLHSYTYLFSQ